MKTITFYSYKGGVGRTLTLSNIASRLAELGKKVCLLDFDLEAPGLPFKFRETKKEIKKGIVDYIYEFSCMGNIPKSIKEYSITIPPMNSNIAPIDLIPAGNIEDNEYWRKLSMINWAEMFYSEKGKGVKFILDLKARIQKEFNPDVLLVDSRTGITDISGITLKLLADEVVILAAYNDENLFGSKKIIKSLLDESNLLFGKSPKINFILTRLPFSDGPNDKSKEISVLDKVSIDFRKTLGISNFDISVIHSDRRLEENERQLIGYEYEEKSVSISNDYLRLFDKLSSDILSPKEVELFRNKKIAEKEYNKALSEKDSSKKLQYIDRAIELDKTKWEYYYERGLIFSDNKDREKAIENFNLAIALNQNDAELYNLIGIEYGKLFKKNRNIKFYELALSNFKKGREIEPRDISNLNSHAYVLFINKKYDESLELLNLAIEINDSQSFLFNNRAVLYRKIEEYEKAYADIYAAMNIDSRQSINFRTLAEIYASENKIEEFYFNLNIALGMGLSAKQMNTSKEVYEKFKTEERFINLMSKYNIDIDEIFQED
jgi:tetratricopeptide (TPR) repeat protein